MQRIIEHIRSKPYEKRNRIIWICAGVTAALLLTIWLLVGNRPGADRDTNFFNTFNQGFEANKNSFPNPLK